MIPTAWGRLSTGERWVAAAYAALAVVLWPSPLLGLLHVESAAIVAGVAFVAAGLAATRRFRRGGEPAAVLGRHLALLAVPWALLTLSLAWRPNCGYALGFALFLLFAVPSVVLSVALAWALTGTRLRRPGLALVGVGAAVAVVPVAYDLGLHPQLYTYNHVWGGVLGPIYDEELAVRPGLVSFRAVTLLWAAWLLALGAWLRRRDGRSARAGAVLSLALGAAYLLAPRLGFVTTYEAVERRLGGWAEAGAFVLHFDPEALPATDLRLIGEGLRYRHAVYRRVLGVAPRRPIHVYLYPDAEVRAALTGARYTSVTPVWLARPQMHLLQEAATPAVLGHELAHVFAREFGMPVLRASPALGLVEGLAVALEPPDGLPAPTEQVAAAAALDAGAAGRLARGPAEAVATVMDPVGFWTGRGAVSYATSGAFVGWLLDRHGAGRFRAAYRTGRFGPAYGRSAAALARDWEADLARVPVTPEARALAAWRFALPSLFERRCPHHVPRAEQLTREARRAWETGDGARARRLYARALRADSTHLPALVGWASAGLPTARTDARLRRLIPARLARATADTADAALLAALGDALRVAGDRAGSARAYAGALDALPPFAHDARVQLRLRARLPLPALHLLLADSSPAERARRLEAVARRAPVAWSFAAALWSAAGDDARALAAIRAFPAQDDPEIEAARLAWRAHFARRAGHAAVTAREAEAAAVAYRRAGLEGPARMMDDRAAEARWVAARGASGAP